MQAFSISGFCPNSAQKFFGAALGVGLRFEIDTRQLANLPKNANRNF
jgi:hypothetical protein